MGTPELAQPQPASATLAVTVVYALPHQIWRRELRLEVGAVLADAIRASGVRQAFPDWDPEAHGAGVFGQRRANDYPLVAGDRVEIYRPLVFEPMESRRRRAWHRQNRQRQNESHA